MYSSVPLTVVMIGVVISVVALALLQGTSAATSKDYSTYSAVELLQEYVQINTTTYNNLTDAVEFWKALAATENVPISVYEYVEGFPVIVIKWEGCEQNSSVMLNSHMDVVPASMSDGWTYPPFSAYIDDNGDIYGRGTQDMKSVAIQYYEALRRLKANNTQMIRTVYMTIMPDEEVGAEAGMLRFLESEEFAAMKVGIELDEGTSYPLPVVAAFYQDKVVWQIQVDCYGEAAHGSTFANTNDTATGKCFNVIKRMFEFRDEQYEIEKTADPSNASNYTSINLNKINGGTANNVVPSHVSLVFDIRLGTTVNEQEFNATLYKWIAEAGSNINLTYIAQNPQSPATYVNSSNPYWTAINDAAKSLGVILLPTVPPGSTDARHVRIAGYPAFGISPMPNTKLLLHSVDEHLNIDTFTKGIDFYEQIIPSLANIPVSETADPSVFLYKTAI